MLLLCLLISSKWLYELVSLLCYNRPGACLSSLVHCGLQVFQIYVTDEPGVCLFGLYMHHELAVNQVCLC